MKRHIVLLLLLSLLATNAYAVAINLGTASTFGLLAGSGVTNTGLSVIRGDVGSSPTPAVTGFPPGIVIGTLYTTSNAVTAQAKTDLVTAYNAAAGAASTMNLTGVDLGFFNAGFPLGPGVYSFSSTAGLTGNLTLDGGGDPNAQWIFQIGSSLTTATNATMSFINGASPCKVFWQIGESATIGTNNTFGGTILALTSITLNGGTLHGRALARNGAVTISAAEFVIINCTSGPRVTVAKVADRAVASAGDVITYTYAVANSGPVALTVDSVVDTRLGDLTADFIAANGGVSTLAVGASTVFTKTYTVLVTDPSPLVNSVAVGASGGGVDVSGTGQASVIITAPGPHVTMVKTANRTVAAVGDFVTYTFKVTNYGMAPLTVNSVVDSHLGDLTADFIAANGGASTLAAGASTSFIEVYTVLATDTSPMTNVATVTAGSDGVIVTSSGQATVIIPTPGPGVTIAKTVYPTLASVGDVITYTFTVSNSGTVPLTVNSVVDSRLGDLTADFIAANLGSNILAVGSSVTFIELHTVLATNSSPLTNSVTVSANNETVVVTDTTEASVTINAGRRCFLPVTLTQQGWHNFCAPALGVPGGLVYNKFPLVFARYGFFSAFYARQVIIGAPVNVITPGSHSITFTGTTSGLTQLCNFLPQTGPAERLWSSFINPSYLLSRTGAKTSNVLAGEVLALTLNIAYNDMRLMPRSRGYDLEKFVLTKGIFKGKTVGQVWNIANAVLSGASPGTFGLTSTTALVSILQSINANYEFVNINTFIDRGYLLPNVPLGQPGPPHPMIVPF
ncbi:MAG: ice-binding family protein [Armatimonadetes bacterium]|nr:ice-binding family protein [Armatimonadota bacterium]